MGGKKERIELSPKTMENFLIGEFSKKKKQKPEIDEKYVSKKIMETMRSLSHLSNIMSSVVYQEIKKKLDKLIRQIVSDVKGGGNDD